MNIFVIVVEIPNANTGMDLLYVGTVLMRDAVHAKSSSNVVKKSTL